ncbi:MAG TPA: hypothetical protein VFF39_07350, partial [Verrucomicrobiae bacterium]|nr:hypothetical protein [Verrucomicrobiae bacterium]
HSKIRFRSAKSGEDQLRFRVEDCVFDPQGLDNAIVRTYNSDFLFTNPKMGLPHQGSLAVSDSSLPFSSIGYII